MATVNDYQLTNLENGLSTNKRQQNLGRYGLPDPTQWHTYFNDFDIFTAAEWVVTETQAGATQVITDEDGGVLLLTNTAADDDLNAIQLTNETFTFTPGKKGFFKARLKLNDATQSDLIAGLQITDTSPLDATDGVFFSKIDGSTSIILFVEKDNVNTQTTVGTLVDDTYIELGFFYNGASSIEAYVNNVLVGTSVVTNLPDDEELTDSFAAQNGEASAKNLSIDYVLAAKER